MLRPARQPPPKGMQPSTSTHRAQVLQISLLEVIPGQPLQLEPLDIAHGAGHCRDTHAGTARSVCPRWRGPRRLQSAQTARTAAARGQEGWQASDAQGSGGAMAGK